MERNNLIQEKILNLSPIIIDEGWLNYKEKIDLNESDKEILFELLQEYDLNQVEIYEASKKTVPIHLWRAISQFGDLKNFEKLLSLLIDINNINASWLQIDFPKITQIYGVETLTLIQRVFDNKEVDVFFKLCLIGSVKNLYHINEDSNNKIQNIIKTYFKNCTDELDADFINYTLKKLVKFNTYDFSDLLLDLDEKELINLNDVEPEILEELFSN